MPLVSHEIYVTYEIGHIDEAREKARCGTTVVCFNFFVECELKKQNIPFVSLREVIDTTTGGEEWLLLSYEVAREWYRLPAMKFFEYDDIRIFEAPEPTMEMYLARLFYYVRIYSALKEKYPGARLVWKRLFTVCMYRPRPIRSLDPRGSHSSCERITSSSVSRRAAASRYMPANIGRMSRPSFHI